MKSFGLSLLVLCCAAPSAAATAGRFDACALLTRREIEEVQEVHNIAGEDCYLVKVRTADSASLMGLMRNKFAKIGSIQSTKTTIVLETVKEEQKLTIPITKK